VREDFLHAARTRTLIGDGAMGTQLQLAGLEPGGCGDLWNLEHPGRVTDIQRRYVEAGSQLLLTNTFGSSRYGLARYECAEKVSQVNGAGARIAREAIGESGWVLGDIGPFGGFVEPLGEFPREEVLDAFEEQARALVDAGVDGIIIETMTAVDELCIAIEAARNAGAKFVVASASFDATRVGLRTMMGTTPQEIARAALDAGADVLGANCGTNIDLGDFARIVVAYRSIAPDCLVMIQSNAGQPELVGSEVVYHCTPEEYVKDLTSVLSEKPNVIGGCCGTTPAHIAMLCSMIG
jgi:5-methyltetrahydrofolate--homocysteine methyltransferase